MPTTTKKWEAAFMHYVTVILTAEPPHNFVLSCEYCINGQLYLAVLLKQYAYLHKLGNSRNTIILVRLVYCPGSLVTSIQTYIVPGIPCNKHKRRWYHIPSTMVRVHASTQKKCPMSTKLPLSSKTASMVYGTLDYYIFRGDFGYCF